MNNIFSSKEFIFENIKSTFNFIIGKDELFCSGCFFNNIIFLQRVNPIKYLPGPNAVADANSQLPIIILGSLPIQLISFTGVAVEDKIIISWQTASEKNNSFFTLEKSFNGIDFQELRRIPGANNSSLLIAYNCEDSKPVEGENYYRLKQTDSDGHEHLFEVIYVRYGGNTKLQLFPNPAGEDRIVALSLPKGGSVNEITVYNSLNEIVFHDAGLQFSVGDKYVIQLSSQLSAGLYHVLVNTTSKIYNNALLLK